MRGCYICLVGLVGLVGVGLFCGLHCAFIVSTPPLSNVHILLPLTKRGWEVGVDMEYFNRAYLLVVFEGDKAQFVFC